MEVRPPRPWLTPTTPRGGQTGAEHPSWWTGTIEDQFLPIYLALAADTSMATNVPRHRGFSPAEVDAMDLTVIWAFLGVEQARAAVAAQHAKYAGQVPVGGMVPLTPEEKAARLERLKARLADR